MSTKLAPEAIRMRMRILGESVSCSDCECFHSFAYEWCTKYKLRPSARGLTSCNMLDCDEFEFRFQPR